MYFDVIFAIHASVSQYYGCKRTTGEVSKLRTCEYSFNANAHEEQKPSDKARSYAYYKISYVKIRAYYSKYNTYDTYSRALPSEEEQLKKTQVLSCLLTALNEP
jgi:hypothetical protein